MLDIFYTSQIQVVNTIKQEINKWEDGDISNQELSIVIKKIVEINREVIYKDNMMRSIVKQRLGKKRIRLIETILKEKGEWNEKL